MLNKVLFLFLFFWSFNLLQAQKITFDVVAIDRNGEEHDFNFFITVDLDKKEIISGSNSSLALLFASELLNQDIEYKNVRVDKDCIYFWPKNPKSKRALTIDTQGYIIIESNKFQDRFYMYKVRNPNDFKKKFALLQNALYKKNGSSLKKSTSVNKKSKSTKGSTLDKSTPKVVIHGQCIISNENNLYVGINVSFDKCNGKDIIFTVHFENATTKESYDGKSGKYRTDNRKKEFSMKYRCTKDSYRFGGPGPVGYEIGDITFYKLYLGMGYWRIRVYTTASLPDGTLLSKSPVQYFRVREISRTMWDDFVVEGGARSKGYDYGEENGF